jgi:hypothetical protein
MCHGRNVLEKVEEIFMRLSVVSYKATVYVPVENFRKKVYFKKNKSDEFQQKRNSTILPLEWEKTTETSCWLTVQYGVSQASVYRTTQLLILRPYKSIAVKVLFPQDLRSEEPLLQIYVISEKNFWSQSNNVLSPRDRISNMNKQFQEKVKT